MKNFFILAFFLTFPITAFAEGKAALGDQGGVTFPDFHFKNSTLSTEYGNKNVWLAGIYGELGVWMLTVRPEINYVTKGYTVANTAQVTNRYLEIPVLLKLNPFGAFVFSPFIVVGPQWSRHLSTEVSVANSSITYNNTVDKTDISAVAGLGFEFNISEMVAASVQGRYSYGLRDIDSGTTEVRTRGFYALAGLTLMNAF